MIHIKSVHHFSVLTCDDWLEATLKFYKTIGFTISKERADHRRKHILLNNGILNLELFSVPDYVEADKSPENFRINHVCLEVDHAHSLAQSLTTALHQKIVVKETDTCFIFSIKDPNGYLIELIEVKN